MKQRLALHPAILWEKGTLEMEIKRKGVADVMETEMKGSER